MLGAKAASTVLWYIFLFFFNDTATTEISTLSLHDALPIWVRDALVRELADVDQALEALLDAHEDRKSTRLHSSHHDISYAVFCLRKTHETHLRCIQREPQGYYKLSHARRLMA